jgi:hypothetical protein
LSSPLEIGARHRAALLALILVAAGFELYVGWLALHPKVDANYRAYYINATTTCLNKPASGKYSIGATVSFLPDDLVGAHPLRVCGWSGPGGDGTHSVGTTSRIRLAVARPAGDLVLRLFLSAIAAPDHRTQHIVLTSGNGVALGGATIPNDTSMTIDFTVPAAAIDQASQSLDVVIAYPTATEMVPRDSDTHLRSIKLMSVQLRRPGEHASEGPEEDPAAQRYQQGPDGVGAGI